MNYDEEAYKINVNGKTKVWLNDTITIKQAVELAFGLYKNPEHNTYTVTYAHGKNNAQGSMVDGDEVSVANGMVFNITYTDKS